MAWRFQIMYMMPSRRMPAYSLPHGSVLSNQDVNSSPIWRSVAS